MNKKKSENNLNYISDNIIKIMRKKGITDAELARRSGLPPSTIHRIVANLTSDPRASTILLLSKALDVNVEHLFSSDLDRELEKNSVLSIPIIEWNEVPPYLKGTLKLPIENHRRWLAVSEENSNNLMFALQGRSSLEPRFPKDSYLIFNSELIPCDGDYALVINKSENRECKLRQIFFDGSKIFGFSILSTVESEVIQKKDIISILVECRASYKTA